MTQLGGTSREPEGEEGRGKVLIRKVRMRMLQALGYAWAAQCVGVER